MTWPRSVQMNSSACFNAITDVARLVDVYFVVTTISLLIFDVLVFCGNLLVVLALLITRKLWTVNGFLIGSLAVADLCVGIVVLPFSIVNEVLKIWIFGSTWCQLYLFIDVWLCTASIYNLVAISFDRFVAISKPLRYRSLITKSRGLCMIFISWLMAFGVSCPPLIRYFLDSGQAGLQGAENNSQTQKTFHESCQCTPMNNDSGYIIFSATASFWMPFLTIFTLYVKIYLIIRKVSRQRHVGMMARNVRKRKFLAKFKKSTTEVEPRSSVHIYEGLRIHRGKCSYLLPKPCLLPVVSTRLRAQVDEVENEIEVDDTNQIQLASNSDDSKPTTAVQASPKDSPKCVTFRFHRRLSHVLIRARQKWSANGVRATRKRLTWELQAVRSVAIVTGCFMVCWLGFAATYTLGAIPQCSHGEGCVSETVFSIVFWLGYANSACNPLIYAMFNNDLRRAFKRIIICCCKIPNGVSDSATTAQRSSNNIHQRHQDIELP